MIGNRVTMYAGLPVQCSVSSTTVEGVEPLSQCPVLLVIQGPVELECQAEGIYSLHLNRFAHIATIITQMLPGV
jgi:hypothetical protein